VVHVVAKANATATLSDNGHDGDTFPDGTLINHSSSGGDATGIGDMILRSKYNIIQNPESLVDLAIYNELKLPTGDVGNLLGTGNTDALAEIVVSKQIGRVAPHLNVGYQFAMGHGTDRSNFRYVVGADASVGQDVTLGLDVLGRQDDVGLNIVDIAIGGKWNVFDKNLITAEFVFPINSNVGLRPDYAWAVRWSLAF
jgi:hypothetical protein